MLARLYRRFFPTPPPAPARWPDRADQVDPWMRSKLAYARAQGDYEAACLFDCSSGDYLPKLIHVGVTFDDRALADYRRLKAENPELVAAARAQVSRYARSVITDPEDVPDWDILP